VPPSLCPPFLPFLLCLTLGLLFGLITWQVVADGPLVRLDERISRAAVRPGRVSDALADLGNVEVAVPVLAAVAAYAARRRRRAGERRWWRPAAGALGLMALVPALVVPVKELTDRPGTPAVPPATGYFPSGHTATAVVAYGCAALLVLPWLRRALVRRAVVAGGAVVNLGVGVGLVRHGYHWPLDVVASWCLGAVLLTVFATSAGVSRSSRRTCAGTPSSRTGPS
jgi:undecaprenyl-diphosphatase